MSKIDKIQYPKEIENLILTTGNSREDFRNLLLKVIKREEFFKVKIDCI